MARREGTRGEWRAAAGRDQLTVEIDGRTVELSHPDKLLYPNDMLSKNDVVAYYQSVAGPMLTHLCGRPLTLRRFPDGIKEGGFFQKEASDYFPEWVRTIEVPQRTQADVVRHVVCDDAATLIYLANQACLEFHVWLSRADSLAWPDRLVVDLDPANGVEIGTLRDAARAVRDLFRSVGLMPFCQSTGSRGFHVAAPLDGAVDFEDVRALARDLADHLAAGNPDQLTTEQRKDQRGSRIFLDVARNAYAQTMVVPYSLRARPGAPVATPLDWAELRRVGPKSYGIGNLGRRLAHKYDPWAQIDEYTRSAARAREHFAALRGHG